MHLAFDGLNRLITVINADLSTSSHAYGDQDDLTAVTDERSLVTTYVRNG